MIFADQHIQLATMNDVTAIVQLLNSAYRGESSKKGWTTEAHLIAGEIRANEAQVTEAIAQPGSVMLKYTLNQKIIACVNLQQHATKIYLGMFSVAPELQGGGIGKKILQAAEEYAIAQQCNAIYMTVIDARHELIAWYKRNGYADTGLRKPFQEDGITGKHLQPLQFAVLEKPLL